MIFIFISNNFLIFKNKYGPLEKRLTHMPFTHAFTGSNPVRVTIKSATYSLIIDIGTHSSIG